MSTHVTGTFEIEMTPHPPYDSTEGVILSRVSIAKKFHGALEGSSTLEMTSAISPIPGSSGYVAIERVVGKLGDRTGSFVLQHSGTMTRKKPELRVTVVPDSATGDLRGLAGAMTIEIIDGQHIYVFDYTLDTE